VRVVSTEQIASLGAVALEGDLAGDAELSVHGLDREALVLGAFQRASSVAADPRPMVGRVSGGPVVAVGRGTLHVVLALAKIDALEPCTPRQIVNRHVRPLLRALTASGATARFFGRDWIDVKSRPTAWVGFAHDTVTGRAVLEAFIAVSSPFAVHPRAAYLGKEPGTLDAILGRSFDPPRIATAIRKAYEEAWGERLALRAPEPTGSIAPPPLGAPPPPPVPPTSMPDEPAWAATVDEAIGLVAAGRDRHGVLRVGGDLLASRDAIARLEARVVGAAPEAIAAIVTEELGDPRVALDGVKSLDSVRDVLARALSVP
jgi:hypothetical protein